MSGAEDLGFSNEPPAVEPYEVLGLDRSATADQVKSAYRKAALRNHPDKVPENQKAAAHVKFQSIASAYAVLSDPARRKFYDATGSTAESMIDSEGFSWSDFYREQYEDSVSADSIKEFARRYKGSDEEKDDLLSAFCDCKGDLDQVYERVMLSNVLEDETRFLDIIDDAILKRFVPAYTAYTKERKRTREARFRAAKAEAAEAEDYAKELGVHDKLFGNKKSSKTKESSKDDLAALIQKRQQDRSAHFLDHLAEKYGAKGSKGKKRQLDEEPSEEAFQGAASKLEKGSGSKAKPGTKSKRSRK